MHVFSGKWLTNDIFADLLPKDNYTADVSEKPSFCDVHVLFRTKFRYDGTSRVYLYFSADDYAKVWLNGKQVCCGPAPGYPFHTYYVREDITPSVVSGENVLAFHTLYQGLVNRVWVSGDCRHGLIFDVVSDGKTLCASTEQNVKVCVHDGFSVSHIIGYDTQFAENYDSRSACDGFEKPEFDDGSWKFAKERKHVDYKLFPQNTGKLVVESLQPQVILQQKDRLVLDFRREFVGYAVVEAVGRCGDNVTVLCGEELNLDCSVRYDMRCNCKYSEVWTLSGKEDVFEPFDYKAFRYVELRFPENVRILSVTGKARHYFFKKTAFCHYKNPDLRRIFRLCSDTLKFALQEGYLDCPSREKGQYFGDGVWSAMAHIALTGDGRLYQKMVENCYQSTFIDPKGCGTAEGPCSYFQAIAEYPLMMIISLKAYLFFTSDRKFVSHQRKFARKVVANYRKEYGRADGLISVYDRWNVVDWPQSARDGYDFDLTQGKIVHGVHNVMNAYWLLTLQTCEELFGDKSFFRSERVAKSYRACFYDEEKKCFRDSETSDHTAIGSQVMGALTGVARDKEVDEILLRMIKQKRLSCSNLFMTPVLLTWLKMKGEEALLVDLLTDDGAWLNMLKEGATTTFEAFSKDGKWNTSLCHTMFAFPLIFLANRKY